MKPSKYILAGGFLIAFSQAIQAIAFAVMQSGQNAAMDSLKLGDHADPEDLKRSIHALTEGFEMNSTVVMLSATMGSVTLTVGFFLLLYGLYGVAKIVENPNL